MKKNKKPTLLDIMENDPKSHDSKRFEFIIGELNDIFEEGMTILDIGPDDGSFTNLFKKIGFKVTTIDLEPKKFEWEHIVGDVQKICLERKFDVIVITEVLEHLKKPDKAMRNVISMSNADTTIIVSVPNFEHPNHVRVYNEKKFKKFIKKYINISKFNIFVKEKQYKKDKKPSKQYLAMGVANGYNNNFRE